MENINSLIEKYWNAETSLEEEARLRDYFCNTEVDDEYADVAALFRWQAAAARMTAPSPGVDMDDLLERYWLAETTEVQEMYIRNYFASGNIDPAHQQYAPLFQAFSDVSALAADFDFDASRCATDIEALLVKYWAAETTLEEERQLRSYFTSGEVSAEHAEFMPLFEFQQMARQAESESDVESVLTQNDTQAAPLRASQSRVISIRKIFGAVAAVFVLGFAAYHVMSSGVMQDGEDTYGSQYVALDEEAEAQEAYEITREALALLSTKMKTGSTVMVNGVSKAEKASIFK